MTFPSNLKSDDIVVLAFSGAVVNAAFEDFDKLITDETKISNETVEFMQTVWTAMQQGVEPVTEEMIAQLEAEEGEIQPDDRSLIEHLTGEKQ